MHLNFQFREPLAPSAVPWSPQSFLKGLDAWQASPRPFTSPVQAGALQAAASSSVGSFETDEVRSTMIKPLLHNYAVQLGHISNAATVVHIAPFHSLLLTMVVSSYCRWRDCWPPPHVACWW